MYAHVNGVKLFFDIEGGGFRPAGHEMSRKPVLFLLHGGPGADHTAFRPFLHPLADDFQLVFIDHRGNGRELRVQPVAAGLVSDRPRIDQRFRAQ